jgi:dolichol-phosphate mannosyltransferase
MVVWCDMKQRVDIVIPVYNEKENFSVTYRLLTEKASSDWNVLLVYDFPEDKTLEAARPISENDPRLRLVKNQSRGVLHAIKTGFKEAQAEAVLVLMVDDPPEVIEKIDELVEQFYMRNATVVVASRYMHGGGHEGGPIVKGLLSLLAGVSLYTLIRLPVHDATYATRMYRKSFLEKISIESKKGFEITLELTLKAYFSGGTIVEIPVSWRERTVGKSRFKLLKWIPAYLGWYLWGVKKYWIG